MIILYRIVIIHLLRINIETGDTSKGIKELILLLSFDYCDAYYNNFPNNTY